MTVVFRSLKLNATSPPVALMGLSFCVTWCFSLAASKVLYNTMWERSFLVLFGVLNSSFTWVGNSLR